MRLLLIGNLAEDRQESMQRFHALLTTGMIARGHQVTALRPTLRLARLGPRYRYGGVAKYLGYFDKFILFPRRLRRTIAAVQPELVHITDHANAGYASAAGRIPALATCHDLLQIRAARGEIREQSVGRLGRWQQAGILASLARLPRLACISAATQRDVLRLTGHTAARTAIIPNALNHPYQPVSAAMARERLAGLSARLGLDPAIPGPGRHGFLLQVGGAQWYKNRPGLLALYAALRPLLPHPPRLVMVGPPLAADQRAQVAQLGLQDHVTVCAGATNPELEALYNTAEGLLFPSWEEGFGWPVAEAQACGCPVFASNRAPMTEVGGESSFYFDPGQPAAAAQIIAAAWPQRPARRELALREARRWEPALMLDAYEALYRSMVAESRADGTSHRSERLTFNA